MIPRQLNEAANNELRRRGLDADVLPSGELPGEAIVFVHTVSRAEWRWPAGLPDDPPASWPMPLYGEVPDYVE